MNEETIYKLRVITRLQKEQIDLCIEDSQCSYEYAYGFYCATGRFPTPEEVKRYPSGFDMTGTLLDAKVSLNAAAMHLKESVLNSTPQLRILPGLRDNNGDLRLWVCIAYAVIAMAVIDATTWLIDLIR